MKSNNRKSNKKNTFIPMTDVQIARLVLVSWGQADTKITPDGTRAILEALAVLVADASK